MISRGEHRPSARLAENDVLVIRHLYGDATSLAKLYQEYGDRCSISSKDAVGGI